MDEELWFFGGWPVDRETVSTITILFCLAPLPYLLYLLGVGEPLHFERPLLNLTAHVLLVATPMLLSLLGSEVPTAEGEAGSVCLPDQNGWRCFRLTWPIMTPIWPVIVIGLVALWDGYGALVSDCGASAETSAPAALAIWILVLLTMALTWGFLFDPETIQISAAGVRTGPLSLVEWHRIDKIVIGRKSLWIFHDSNRTVPFAEIAVNDNVVRELIGPATVRHGIRTERQLPQLFVVFQLMMAAIGVAGTVIGWRWLRSSDLHPVWIVASLGGAGLLVGLLIDGLRGVHKAWRPKLPRLDNL